MLHGFRTQELKSMLGYGLGDVGGVFGGYVWIGFGEALAGRCCPTWSERSWAFKNSDFVKRHL